MYMKRRKHSKEFKLQVVKEALEVGNKALVARRYELSPNLVQRWVKAYEEGKLGQEMVSSSSSAEIKRLEEENEQLKKLLGEKDLEIAILRDLIKKKNPHLLKNWK
ncbi:Transposase and inactivated derivatives [Parageobacillus thermantarcticus]|jgi:transposase|uniref:Transposase and inactivated derivatives n=1 Tax=Parageobacillus thermantarcticus TaxID=186116 RepID=A0A1I0TLP9_9BACL|nr:Transposase and inactivated derivatives [Parageobacillus thermantarcticus]